MFMIYGKHITDRRFSPMDMNMAQPVKNKIYATVYKDGQRPKIEESLKTLRADNPDWKFEIRNC